MSSDMYTMIVMQDLHRISARLREFECIYGGSYNQFTRDLLEKERLLRGALPDLGSPYHTAIASFRQGVERLHEFERGYHPGAVVARAHQDLSSLLSKNTQLEDIARASIALRPQWEEHVAAYQKLTWPAPADELALKAHCANVAESALLAQERLLRVPWEALGSATTMHVREFAPTRRHFTALADSYGLLIRSLDEREHFIAAFPPIVSSGPPLEIYTSACVLDVLSRQITGEDYPDSDVDVDSDLEDEIQASVDELLVALNPDLHTMWLGAKEALLSTNPDRRRHVAFSLRELVSHVLRILAPDDAVREWSADPSHFRDGRPTRRSRLLFACRGINHDCFTEFVSADVRVYIELVQLLQRGHELAVSFTEAQLRTLVIRTESLLKFLLLISRTTE